MLLKRIGLYLIGLTLLLFGNRRAIEDAIEKIAKSRPIDENKDIEKKFETQKLAFDTANNVLVNNSIYFQTIWLGDNQLRTPSKRKTTIETDSPEIASDSH